MMENRKTHDKTCASKHTRWTQLNVQLTSRFNKTTIKNTIRFVENLATSP